MYVTIMSDASVDNDLSIGGYGYWIASDRGKLGGGGRLKSPIKDSYDGELKAIVNALHIALVKKLVLSGDTVLLQLDNLAVVNLLDKKATLKRKCLKEVINHFTYLVSRYSLNIVVRHVKGHSNSSSGNRFAANNHCDAAAKYHMRSLRKEVKKQG